MTEAQSTGQRLTIVIHGLSGGGAERTAALLAGGWAERGCNVTLITLSAAMESDYELHPAVRRLPLDVLGHSPNALAAAWNNVRRLRRLRHVLRESRPDRIISLIDRTNVLTLLAAGRLRRRVIVCERIDPRHHNIGTVWSALRRRLYPRAAAVVVQTQAVAKLARSWAGPSRVVVIANAVPCPAAAGPDRWSGPDSAIGESAIVAAGRLVPQKGFDLLIEAFARIAGEFPDWNLVIYGEGAQRPLLESQISAAALNGRVRLPGRSAEWSSSLGLGGLFVLSSRYEGFPNVLLEAMSRGAAAVACDCPSGPAEIVRHDVDGLLVASENVEALAAAMQRLIADRAARERLGLAAREVVERFSVERFFEAWRAVLEIGVA